MSNRITNLCQQALAAGDRIVVAVSGGADSLCLAHALHQGAAAAPAKLFVAHVNHQLRGKAAEADARFVCNWAAEAGLPRAIVRVNVQRRGGQSIQTIARAERYQALLEVCQRFGANKLATGHHADDQVETFLLNLLRGSGSKGLQGIPRERFLSDGIVVVRPLLEVTRGEIEEYCAAYQLAWRIDSSNASMDYLRNRIRHQLLPQLREINPGIDGVLLNTINNLRQDQELLDGLTRKALAAVTVSSPLSFAPNAISAAGLRRLAPALQNRVVLELLPDGSETRHVQAVLNLLGSQTGATLDLPGNCRAYRLHDSIALGGPPVGKRYRDTRVPIPGRVELGEVVIITGTEPLPGSVGFWLPEHSRYIVAGSRRPGDYFYPPGGGKKLKDYMIDRKIPRWLRNSCLVLRAEENIIWVAGLAFDQRFTQPGDGKKLVYIKLETRGGKEYAKEYWRNLIGSTGNSR